MLEESVESAFVYTYPLYAVAQTRLRATDDAANPHRHAPNTLLHERQLSDHTARWITAPNNDTLYSNAWLDLSQGPVHVRVAQMPPGRYWSLAFMDAYTDHFGIVGERLDGQGPVDLVLVAPGAQPPADGARVIRAPGQDAWLFARCLVDGPADLPNSLAMQEAITVTAPAGAAYPQRVAPTSSLEPRNYLAVVNEWLARNPPPAADAARLAQWSGIGIEAGRVDAWDTLAPTVRAAWNDTLGPAHERLRQASKTGRRQVQGWYASAPEMGNFGANHLLRASVALGGLGALPHDEAMYFVRFHDDDGQALDGNHRYLLRVPPAGIPTDSFWSFSMYEPTADGRRFFADNPIRRYSIGNRTAGLLPDADGSLRIPLQSEEPTEPRLRANWLPAPAGPFQIALRTYLPRRELRDGTAPMPTITKVQP